MRYVFATFLAIVLSAISIDGQQAHIRINQVGYLSAETKTAAAFSAGTINGRFRVRHLATDRVVLSGKLRKATPPDWGSSFTNFYSLDISPLRVTGRYRIELDDGTHSRDFNVGGYPNYQEDLLSFMRQQRCGFNPVIDSTCHLKDGLSFYAPFKDETFVDAVGGWHDAGDQLKYLITASNATARMLLAYELEKSKFADLADSLGREGRPNGIPDILDEAYWGLVWIHKLHPRSDLLIHQIADDRDHRGFKLPNNDNADYGWGPNSFRPAYFADGKPQGLGKWKSRSTGVANIAGRSAAAMAMASHLEEGSEFSGFCGKMLKRRRRALCHGQKTGRIPTG